MQEKSLFEHFKEVVTQNYANFEGRARRREYWGFILFYLIFYIGSAVVFSLIDESLAAIAGIFALAMFVPNLAVAVRRLHDVGKSGWFLLIGLIPLIGGIWLLVLNCTDSDAGTNEYGPNPKNPANELDEIGEA
ncbi:DUF805 domain-containing protein [Bacteroidia bacterium]|nr:DUF805 domain-containing protein [Bacteroidia bacterium]MDB4174194.1 DUF805 domain-containing protein [Bacteroidia bacterium]